MAHKSKRILVITHGDLDGIISAALAMLREGQPESIRLIFTQPYLLDKVEIPKETKIVYVFDIAVNNRDPEMTKKFIEKLGNKLAGWYDHHAGWEKVLGSTKTGKYFGIFRIDPEAKACAELLASASQGDSDFIKQLVSDAVASDTRTGQLSSRGRLIEEAIKADLSDDSVREAAVWWLVNGCQKDSNYKRLQEAQKRYQGIQRNTEELARQYQIHHGIAVVDARETKDYDRTQLLLFV